MIYISETAFLINMNAILDIEYHLDFFKYISESRYVSIIRYKVRNAPSQFTPSEREVDQTEDQNQLNRNPSSLIPDGNRFSF
jgi:hypothetical protein